MGSCVSVHKSSESVMKFGLSFGSKNEKLEIPPSPVKEKPAGGDIRIKDVALAAWSPTPSARTFGDYGSKEEAFFDSHPWLESDCEDDFYSVNGDFTPSRGSTPASHGSGRLNKTPFEARLFGAGRGYDNTTTPTPTTSSTTATPSPTEKKKKRLLELFKESIRDDEEEANNRSSTAAAVVPLDAPPKSGRGTPFLSGANSVCSSSERTPKGEYEEKAMRSKQCCLPSLVYCRSLSERKKKMSPAIAVNE